MDFSDISGVIWDFDGVFYSYDVLKGFDFFNLADEFTAKAAIWSIPGLDRDEALRLSRLSHSVHENPVESYTDIIREKELPEDLVKLYLFNYYQRTLFDYVSGVYPHFTGDTSALVDAFGHSDPNLRHMIVSHSSEPFWISPTLKIIGLSNYFPPETILGHEEYGFESKKDSARGVEQALTTMQLHPSQAVFIEDNLPNLQRAKKAFPELRTVLVSGREFETLPDGVDYVVSNAAEFLETLNAAPKPQAVAQQKMAL